ncbi:MAG: hypothetical protein CL484_15750 [Acidobacteria bacterium]|nr:hypothetical protein [Acidobacteriota bacterium]
MCYFRCLFSRFLLLSVALSGLSCGSSSPTGPSVATVSVTTSATSLVVGETATLRATLVGVSAMLPLVYASDNLGVATVNADGLVTAVGFGTATISARHSTGPQGSVTIRVFPYMTGRWEVDIVSVSCTKIEEGPGDGPFFAPCNDDAGSAAYIEFTIGSQTSVSPNTMKLTGLFDAGTQKDLFEATVNTAGQLDWFTQSSSESVNINLIGNGTYTWSREGVFQVSGNGTSLSGEYVKTNRYHGFADSSITAIYSRVWRVLVATGYDY